MIKLVKKEVDNGITTCDSCVYFEPEDYAAGIAFAGCTHAILYDDEDNIIEEINDAIIECLENPNNCCLYCKN